MTMRRFSLPSRYAGSIYIQASSPGGVVSRMADDIEAHQIDAARVFLAVVDPMLEADRLTSAEAAYILKMTTDHLRDVVAVAESRGERLERYVDEEEADGE
ncbi:hypothetical protein ACIBL8_35080 [Streptomyces sp. NPDC050523]|uniref:hypothetical protein n=1 Tax=Streptomyces sp. NPDC050523 TaxID=3365622 RepID=UPI00379205B3